jgi:hypothetical protein
MALISLSTSRFRGHEIPQYSLTEKIGVSDVVGTFPPLYTSSLSPRQMVTLLAPSFTSCTTITISASAGFATICNLALVSLSVMTADASFNE